MASSAPARPQSTAILFLSLLAFRMVNALTLRTFFQPDEYFQSLEPAWKWAFGLDSGAWITWEWKEHLRSSIHPLLFSVVYALADGLSTLNTAGPNLRAHLLLAAPKILQAIFAATTDLFTYKLAMTVWPHNPDFASASLMLSALSPWQWFCSVRTLSNSLETTMTVAALTFWPWSWFLSDSGPDHTVQSDASSSKRPHDQATSSNSTPTSLSVALCLAATACILRPTNLLIWISICAASILRYRTWSKVLPLLSACIICGSAVLAVTVAVDRAFYGEFAFPPLRFLYFNLVQSLAVFYGKNRPDYYLTEGLPLLLTTALPFAGVGIARAIFFGSKPSTSASGSSSTPRILFLFAAAVVVSIMTLSLISHKEVRFIFPLLPLLHVLAANPLLAFCNPFRPATGWWRRGVLVFLLAANVVIAYYVSYVHQRGVVDVVHYLRHTHEALIEMEAPLGSAVTTVGFLMPCHSTPWRSHLIHPNINAWALTCEPPLSLSLVEREHYLDEADVFYINPEAWLRTNMDREIPGKGSTQLSDFKKDGDRRPWPRYVAFFQQLEPTIQSVLGQSSYEECWRGFNTHWHDDWRRQGDVILWCIHS